MLENVFCAISHKITIRFLIADDEDERNLRRVSYLKATKEDRMHIDSDAEEHATEQHLLPSTPKHRYKTELPDKSYQK